MKELSKEKEKLHKFELLKDFSIARVCISDRDQDRSRRRNRSQTAYRVKSNEYPNSKEFNEAGSSPRQRQHTNLNLTENEKLQLRWVLTQQNCSDCGLW